MCAAADCLSRLQAVQDLDGLDPEGAEPLLSAMLAAQPQNQQQGPGDDTLLSSASALVWKSYTWTDALDALRGYLTSMTAKDCSVMVTLQRLQATTAANAPQQEDQQSAAGSAAAQQKEEAGGVHAMHAIQASSTVPLAAAAAQLAEERETGPWPAVVALNENTAFMYQVRCLCTSSVSWWLMNPRLMEPSQQDLI